MNVDPLPAINDRGPAEEERRAQNREKFGARLAEIKGQLTNRQETPQQALVALGL